MLNQCRVIRYCIVSILLFSQFCYSAGFIIASNQDTNTAEGMTVGIIHDFNINRHEFLQFQSLYKQSKTKIMPNSLSERLTSYSIELNYLWKLPLSRSFQPVFGVGGQIGQEQKTDRFFIHPNGRQFVRQLRNAREDVFYITAVLSLQGKDFGVDGLLLFTKITANTDRQELSIGIGYQNNY